MKIKSKNHKFLRATFILFSLFLIFCVASSVKSQNHIFHIENLVQDRGIDLTSENGHSEVAKVLIAERAEEKGENSNDACRKKKDMERIIKNWWEKSSGVAWILALPMLPGRIILWLFFSIGCWIG